MLTIDKNKISDFLKELGEKSEVFDLRNEMGGGPRLFKKYFFPAEQEIFMTYRLGGELMTRGNSLDMRSPSGKNFVLFGLNLPDLEALAYLDQIMEGEYEDGFYFDRRKKSLVIGVVNENVDVISGGDIVFVGDRVITNTDKGHNFVKHYKKFFTEINQTSDVEATSDVVAPQIPENSSLSDWQKEMRKLLLDPETLANAVEKSRGSKIWEEMAGICLGCGNCTYVCPLCYCFSIEDKVGLDGKCSRCRKWDACTLPNFAKIAGGHNFRPTIKERYYNWFYHKFVRAYKEYGKSQCVGCGRCKHSCPAKIDILEVLKRILAEYNAK